MAINPGDGKEASTEFFLKYVGELSIIILLRKKVIHNAGYMQFLILFF